MRALRSLLCFGAGQILADLLDGLFREGIADGVALETGGRLDGVDQGVEACGGGDAGRERLGHAGVQDGYIGEQVVAQELHLDLNGGVGDDGD